jgi:RND family efflux transporter MFP subunit
MIRLHLSAGVLMLTAALLSGCRPAAVEEIDTSAAVPVVVQRAVTKTIIGLVTATATVTPAAGADQVVTAPDSARISAIPHAEGDRVNAGDLLVRFDVPPLEATLAQHRAEIDTARARLDQARANAERLTGLFDRGVAARKDVEDANREVADAQGALLQAESATRAAEALANRTVVRARFAGVVAKRWHNPGDIVEPSASDPVLRIIDPRRLQLVAAVPVSDLTRFAPGHRARVMDPAGHGRDAEAVVAGVPAAVEPASATADVRLTFTGPTALTAGTPVQVEIAGEEHANVVTAPASALVREGADTFVLVAGPDNKAHRRRVIVGLIAGPDAEIRSGLHSGEAIVVRGQDALPDGAAISVTR